MMTIANDKQSQQKWVIINTGVIIQLTRNMIKLKIPKTIIINIKRTTNTPSKTHNNNKKTRHSAPTTRWVTTSSSWKKSIKHPPS